MRRATRAGKCFANDSNAAGHEPVTPQARESRQAFTISSTGADSRGGDCAGGVVPVQGVCKPAPASPAPGSFTGVTCPAQSLRADTVLMRGFGGLLVVAP